MQRKMTSSNEAALPRPEDDHIASHDPLAYLAPLLLATPRPPISNLLLPFLPLPLHNSALFSNPSPSTFDSTTLSPFVPFYFPTLSSSRGVSVVSTPATPGRSLAMDLWERFQASCPPFFFILMPLV